MNLAELGSTFRQARLAANMTQDEVAIRSGVPRVRISAFENASLIEFGAVKMLSLFQTVGFELLARPRGQSYTLDDVANDAEIGLTATTRRRVRHARPASLAKNKGQESAE